ncbi:MAG TPA: hypothetical protein VMR19_01430 [Candidatus Saccharimonadales bacterium]|jgi:hypothetical protein|nr:hypothetical protein [Candidatus Saccharimonadales bacterium]
MIRLIKVIPANIREIAPTVTGPVPGLLATIKNTIAKSTIKIMQAREIPPAIACTAATEIILTPFFYGARENSNLAILMLWEPLCNF